MDWISRVLRGIIEFTQDGGEINVVVTGINVGAQPYWNAEATMLMHTKGILVMTPDSAMVLTGKQSLDYSGGVSAEDNFGIGGYDRIMGPNGQAQYWAPDLSGRGGRAARALRAHLPGARRALPAARADDRPGRPRRLRRPARRRRSSRASGRSSRRRRTRSARSRSTSARCCARWPTPTTRRWSAGWTCSTPRTSSCYDAHLGGHPVALLGIESRPLPRRGPTPVDGPTTFTAGTLFPRSSKKTARAINAASGNRPLVVLANLSGFDGSPESLRAAAAGVRRGDRPGGGQLRRPDRVLRGLAATTAGRSWCSPGR